jgi:hypothetical protein
MRRLSPVLFVALVLAATSLAASHGPMAASGLAAPFGGLVGESVVGRTQSGPSADVSTLARWLVGVFDTSQQADADTKAGATYVHDRVRLQIAGPLALSGGSADEVLLYVEQAQYATLDKPYRQRVYRLRERDQHAVLEVWRIATPARFVGGTTRAELLSTLTRLDLSHEEGCDVTFSRSGDQFKGAIQGKTCKSSWNGSSYVLSEMTVTTNGQHTLDRGFDAQDRQTFGPRNGEAYQFIRIDR